VTQPQVERAYRVPFVRACVVVPGGGNPYRALVVNMSVLGSYVASDESVRVGQTLRVRFTVPGNVLESEVVGAVVWVNPTQEHPVHSLPSGFGIRFLGLDAVTRRRIEGVVREYLARFPTEEP
jgi:Tfp pilus assembly protein PilZ